MLTIIIINYNSGGALRRCLHSIVDAGFTGQVIVRDNGSSDDSLCCPPLGLDLRVIRGDNIGYGAACNLAAQECGSPYLLFLNPDILLTEECISLPLEIMQGMEECATVGVSLQDEEGKLIPSCMHFPKPRHLFAKAVGLNKVLPNQFPNHYCRDQSSSRAVDCVLGAFLMVRRSAFEQCGGFDPAYFLYFEEIDLAQRLRRRGYLCYYCAQCRATHLGGASTRKTPAAAHNYYVKSRRRYARTYHSGPSFMALAAASALIEPWLRALFYRKNSMYRRNHP